MAAIFKVQRRKFKDRSLMIRIEEICDKVRRNHPEADLNLLRRA